ncbi:hypothetical protein L914_08435 [Phytophthora nicotianae]|uniref:Uncharacterized protein n=1 Tax=Phytophthora nicotianae TaxID=4792 RepID=W2NDT6_PHYNI|nr:hypothetical protein L914_08435 [Phytophthora nicotianae]
MPPTGIPPYIELYQKLDRQQQSVDELPSRLEERMERVLEKKGVAAGNITREMLRVEIRSLLNEVGLQRSMRVQFPQYRPVGGMDAMVVRES